MSIPTTLKDCVTLHKIFYVLGEQKGVLTNPTPSQILKTTCSFIFS